RAIIPPQLLTSTELNFLSFSKIGVYFLAVFFFEMVSLATRLVLISLVELASFFHRIKIGAEVAKGV
ncbi:MAG: hypothetical protein QGI37_13225, partial [Verrucomicrobiota bacterium]|nr:hypothetical protein [Verrucomicrobiota bacterium]